MKRALARAAVAYASVGLPVGVVAAVAWLRSGGSIRGAAGIGALGTITGPPILAGAIRDWFR